MAKIEAGRAQRDEGIREAAAAGMSVREIARELGLSSARVHQILHGR